MATAWASMVDVLHLVAAVGALVLALWQLSRGRDGARTPALRACAVALITSALWSCSVIALGGSMVLTDLLLSASYLAWLWLLYRLFAADPRGKGLGPIRAVVAALAFVELLQMAIALAGFGQAEAGVLEAELLILRFAAIFRLLFCIGALVLAHNLYVGASRETR